MPIRYVALGEIALAVIVLAGAYFALIAPPVERERKGFAQEEARRATELRETAVPEEKPPEEAVPGAAEIEARRLEQENEALEAELRRIEESLASTGAEVEKLRAWRERIDSGLLPRASLPEFIETLSRAPGETSGFEVRSVAQAPQEQAGAVESVNFTIAGVAGYSDLVRYVDSLEGGGPLVQVHHLEITASEERFPRVEFKTELGVHVRD